MTNAEISSTPVHTIEIPHAKGIYPVYIGEDLITQPSVWSKHITGKVLVVTEDNVGSLYERVLQQAWQGDAPLEFIHVPSGEGAKTIEHWSAILDRLVAIKAQRDATILALGGGVIGDLAGFAAASYMRGIGVIHMPTTLLAQVDASIGGKTGINHPKGKNLIGAFHAPNAVVIDLATLKTLGARDYRAGLAEVIKYGAIGDSSFFAWLEDHTEAINQRDAGVLQQVIQRSVEAKKAVVMADERESGQRALLNFGHTFGHALETLTGYQTLVHGEAVAIGMVLASRLSERLGLSPSGTTDRLHALIVALGLPSQVPEGLDAQLIVETMQLDKKNKDGAMRLVLLRSLGEAVLRPCSEAEIHQAFDL